MRRGTPVEKHWYTVSPSQIDNVNLSINLKTKLFSLQHETKRIFVISFRSILTDPEIHQKLHDSHYEQQSRYYGYWYGTDLYAYDSQVNFILYFLRSEKNIKCIFFCI